MQHRISTLATAGLALAASVLAPQSALAVTTTYNVTQVYNQIVYDTSNPGWDTTFTGSFSYDSDTQTVTGLSGTLTQAMTGNTGTRELTHQLSAVADPLLGGVMVSAFFQDSTDVFMGGGFATGGMKEFGNQNAYVTIFVPTAALTAELTIEQSLKLAYGDCTTGSLMGSGTPKTCMTGWINPTTLGAGGTMKGTYPIHQTITAAVPEPGSYALMAAGLAVLGLRARRRS